jgi:hypothetical protein
LRQAIQQTHDGTRIDFLNRHRSNHGSDDCLCPNYPAHVSDKKQIVHEQNYLTAVRSTAISREEGRGFHPLHPGPSPLSSRENQYDRRVLLGR